MMYTTWILSKIGPDDLGAGGDLQNFEASKSVDICWPWSLRRNLLANLITLHKHQTSASFMDKTLKIWESFKVPKNKHVESGNYESIGVSCWLFLFAGRAPTVGTATDWIHPGKFRAGTQTWRFGRWLFGILIRWFFRPSIFRAVLIGWS